MEYASHFGSALLSFNPYQTISSCHQALYPFIIGNNKRESYTFVTICRMPLTKQGQLRNVKKYTQYSI